MSRTMEQGTLEVSLVERRAQATFLITSINDFYTRGAAVDWVAVDGSADISGASNWCVDEQIYREAQSGGIKRLTVIVRLPGYDWTWVNLAPIEQRGLWTLIPSSKNITGTVYMGYWPVFSNWNDADNWLPAAKNTVAPNAQTKTWIVEFITTDDKSRVWIGKKNGTWPTGFNPPVVGAGVYYCVKIRAVLEGWRDPITGSLTDYYRHFATLIEAPTAPTAGQLIWDMSSW